MANMKHKRIQKEIRQLMNNPPPGVKLSSNTDTSVTLDEIIMELTGADSTLYAGEVFKLLFKFNDRYPFDSPQVMFIGEHIPIHPHIYSNGHICLSILTSDWSPALSIESICLSIISMLSSCKEKIKPIDNDMYVPRASSNPKDTSWWYHDDNV